MPATAKVASPRPTSGMHVSPEGLQRIRGTESVEYRYYNDMGKNRGHCTWGIGILAHRGVCTQEELGRPVSAAQVEAEFSRQIAQAEGIVYRNVHVELSQTQFDSLVSFVFNAGPGGAHDTFVLLNNDDFAGAGANIQKLVRVRVKTKTGVKKVVARGLVRRRAEEAAPFLDTKE